MENRQKSREGLQLARHCQIQRCQEKDVCLSCINVEKLYILIRTLQAALRILHAFIAVHLHIQVHDVMCQVPSRLGIAHHTRKNTEG